jgi:glycosyltransferase involved in cell wall biosynthesis
MKILQVSTTDIAGGAEKVAFNMHQAYQNFGHQSLLVVGQKMGADLGVIEINQYAGISRKLINFRDWLRQKNLSVRGFWRLSDLVNWIAQPGKMLDIAWGIEDFHYPGSRHLLTLTDELPDIIHAHNLHGGYFDLRYLPNLSQKIPLVITLHDEWMLSGHCAYTLGCERWEGGCGSCPDLTIYPAIKRDATSYNWKRKRKLYQKSNLYIATPSQWLMERVQRSMMKPVEYRVIPNGVDLKLYYPGERLQARHELGLSGDTKIILSVANQSVFKDNATIMDAVKIISKNEQLKALTIYFVALGGNVNETQGMGNIMAQKVRYISDPGVVARYFQAADIFLHAAKAENFPNTIVESFACGTPVVATDVGGIREQVEDGITGFLTPRGDSGAMAERIVQLIKDDSLRTKMGEKASDLAREKFGLDRQVNEYLNWYKEILKNHALSKSE